MFSFRPPMQLPGPQGFAPQQQTNFGQPDMSGGGFTMDDVHKLFSGGNAPAGATPPVGAAAPVADAAAGAPGVPGAVATATSSPDILKLLASLFG